MTAEDGVADDQQRERERENESGSPDVRCPAEDRGECPRDVSIDVGSQARAMVAANPITTEAMMRNAASMVRPISPPRLGGR